mmetsp:Transcript_4076/g.12885  ORF Transcript_4076/g.12885 Transcript_4076/m.12885 type:complete len:111 (+) Transcript_4076:129-461(+)
MTTIWSESSIVERRCATTSVVRPARACSSASWTSFSDRESSADVASSRSRSFGSRTSARAMATRCFWPPESRPPRGPRPSVHATRPSSRKSSFASAATSASAPSVASGAP